MSSFQLPTKHIGLILVPYKAFVKRNFLGSSLIPSKRLAILRIWNQLQWIRRVKVSLGRINLAQSNYRDGQYRTGHVSGVYGYDNCQYNDADHCE